MRGRARKGWRTMAEDLMVLEEARAIVLAHVEATEVEPVPLYRAAGLPAADDVATDIDLSPFANSAMDGYAVRSVDLASASPARPASLSVIAHEAAGVVYEGVVGPGEAVRIMTGAPLPAGADAVVKYEVVEVVGGDGNEGSLVRFEAPAQPGENVREAGLEARAGEVVLRRGEVLSPAGCGLLASAGASEVPVHRAPVVGILSIGTELVSPDAVPGRGQIRDANASALMAAVVAAGGEPRFLGIAGDSEEEIARLMLQAAGACDLVVSSGGASAGDYDFVTELVRREGSVLFDRVSMRPGKAITFGMIRDTPYLGLSGNPAAACVGFEMLARPALRKMRGYSDDARPVQYARTSCDVRKGQARRFYDRAVVSRNAAGELEVTPARSQNSALLGTLQQANCLLMVPDGDTGYVSGDLVPCVRIDIPEGTVL